MHVSSPLKLTFWSYRSKLRLVLNKDVFILALTKYLVNCFHSINALIETWIRDGMSTGDLFNTTKC